MPVKKTLTVNIPEPCDASWAAMQPVNGCSRFCAHCEKVVIDFSNKSDEEIIKILTERKDNPPCGRFTPAQLNRPMAITEQKKPFQISILTTKVAAAILFIPAFLQQSYGQARQTVKTEQAPLQTHNNPVVLKGKITDALNGKPLMAMEISIDKLNYVKYSDKYGNFSFTLPAALRNQEIIITAKYQPTASPETEQSIIEPATILVSDSLEIITVSLKRLPFEKLDTVMVEGTIINPRRTTFGGPPIISVDYTKKSFWQRLTGIFKRKSR